MPNRVIVLGSINLDLVTRVEAHPKPGETVPGSDYQQLPGGKGANQALAAAKIMPNPADVILLGSTGKDDFADKALENLRRAGVDLSHLLRQETGTGIAMIAVSASGENNIIVCPGANAKASAKLLTKLNVSRTDVVLTQQEIPATEVWIAHKHAKSFGARVVHNSAPATGMPVTALKNIDFLIVNENEAISIGSQLALPVTDPNQIGRQISRQFDLDVVLTLGESGAAVFSKGEGASLPASKVNVIDTTGAGDVFCGTFAAMLAQRTPVKNAVAAAVDQASQACTHFGAQLLI